MPWPDHASYSTHSSSSYVLCSPLREYHAASAWAEMLRCDEPHVVQGGSENLSEALSRTAWCYHPPAVEYQYL